LFSFFNPSPKKEETIHKFEMIKKDWRKGLEKRIGENGWGKGLEKKIGKKDWRKRNHKTSSSRDQF